MNITLTTDAAMHIKICLICGIKLQHLAFQLLWWAHLGSNQGPTGYEPVALPIELWARHYFL